MRKKLLVVGAGVFLSTGAMALTPQSLVLTSGGHIPSSITSFTVKCGQSASSETPKVPIPAPGSTIPLAYEAMFWGIGSHFFCDFFETNVNVVGKDIGRAELTIPTNYSTATLNSYTNNDPTDYTITASTPAAKGVPVQNIVGVPETSLSVTLTHN